MEKTIDLSHVTYKLYHIMLYQVPCDHDHDSPSSDCITEHRVYETVFVAKICFEVMLYLPQSITIF